MSNHSAIIDALKERHTDEKVTYACCAANGCWDANCILRVRSKGGKVTAIEPDDSINRGIAREDAYIGDRKVDEGMVQMRPCVMGHSWKAELYAEDRITKPMKRVGGRGHGNGHFEEISWEEAIDTISGKLRETVARFGKASILHTHLTFFEISGFPLWPYMEGPVASWSDHSTSGNNAGEVAHIGYSTVRNVFQGQPGSLVGYEAPDLFNSKLIIMWGWDPLVGWHGAVPYYLKLAKERGAKVICIDPRYTLSAEVLSDQWIPIRPGTDLAMMLAMTQVILSEDLTDKKFCEQWVEQEGLAKYKNYVMGGEDGEAKTPEWAEKICGVPAQTIRELARLYARSGPVHLQAHYSISKRHYGDYANSAAILLQAITGNLAIPGGCQTGSCLVTAGHMPSAPDGFAEFQKAPPEHFPKPVMVLNKLAEAVLLRDDLESGKITEQDYRHAIGCPDGSPTPNIQFVFFGNNWLNTLHDTNKRLKAAEKLHFTCGYGWRKGSPTVEYLDIVLPAPIFQFESTDPYHLNMQRFRMGPGGMNNYMFYTTKSVNPPEGVRPIEWFWTQVANKLGFGEKYNPLLKDTPWDKWDEEVEKLYAKAYEKWRKDEDGRLAAAGIKDLPAWEDFLKNPVVRVPIDTPFHAFKNTIGTGKDVFLTPSGKVEPYSNFIATRDISRLWGGKMDPMPRWKPTYMHEPPHDSFFSPRTRDYPLSMVTPVSLYRQLSAHDRNELLRDCYSHRVWLNPADAKSRDILDNDEVMVYNDRGQAIMRAYVTSKIMPGTTAIHFGGWFTPNDIKTETSPYGIDTRGNCNLFIPDQHLPHAVNSILTAGLVEVKKFGGAK